MTVGPPPPVLATGTFEEILVKARARIARYTPEWTDFNDSDPGIALVQLFAWFTESLNYQMNQVPELHYGKFLDLLGITREPPRPASAVIVFTPPATPQLTGVTCIPALTASRPVAATVGPPVVFEMTVDLPLVRRPLTRVLRGNDDLTAQNGKSVDGYWPFGESGDKVLCLAFAAGPGDQCREVFPNILTIHVVAAIDACAANNRDREGDGPDKAELIVEALVGWGTPERLAVLSDETDGLTQSGFIRIRGPVRATPTGAAGGKPGDFCLELRRAAAGRVMPKVLRIDINAVRAEALLTVRDEPLGKSTGLSGQTFQLRRKPVDIDTIDLRVDEARWNIVPDLIGSDDEAKVAALDPIAGLITFGDDRHGRIPPAGADIKVRRYRAGGGANGNVGAGSITFAVDQVTGKNPLKAIGGSDAETIEAAKRRAPRRLRNLDRAVTDEDYADLAKMLDGVAQVKVLPRTHPDFPELSVAGAVTLLVAPPIDPNSPAAPFATPALCKRVAEFLEERRILGVELFVRAAKVCKVRVEAKLVVEDGAYWPDVERAAQRCLSDFLNDPRRGFGPRIVVERLGVELEKVPGVVESRGLIAVLELGGRSIVLPRDELVFADWPEAVVWAHQHQMAPERPQ